MKIVKRVGERLLPDWIRAEIRPVLACAGIGTALWAGSYELARRGWSVLCEHLDWRERLLVLASSAYVAVYECLQYPHIAKFAVPGALGAWCLAAWWVVPPATAHQDEPETASTAPDPQDITDLVRDLIGDDRGTLLTALRPPLQAPDTRAVRQLLATAGIPVRPGVRTAAGNGPGVHRDDLPPLPPPPTPAPDEGVAAGQTANTNANNRLRVHAREGMTIINDPADRHRTHSLKKVR